MSINLARRVLMEAVGTATLAFAISRLSHSNYSPAAQACGIGLSLCLLIHLFGRLSGAHFNPAVTLLLNQQRFGWRGLVRSEGLAETLGYWVAQLVGGVLVLRLDPVGAGTAAPGISPAGFLPELVFSAALYGLILVWSHEGKICPFAQPLSGVVIGLGLTALAMLGGLSNSGIYNPAIAAGLFSQGVDGIGPMLLAELLAVLALISLRPDAPRRS